MFHVNLKFYIFGSGDSIKLNDFLVLTTAGSSLVAFSPFLDTLKMPLPEVAR